MIVKKFIPVNVPKIFTNEKKYINDCLKTNWISSEGKYVKLFEKKFSSFVKKKYGIAVSSGTAALEIAVKSLNLKKNSEVIIPAFSIISTANAVIKNNLKPVLVDCDINTWNMCTDDTLKKINKNTKAIIITHIYGLPVDMEKILKIAKKKNIKIIEDAAEAIGLRYKNKICGSFGDISIFSFYANKHITTGEGGMICTNKKKLAEECISLRNLSFSKSFHNRFNHNNIGWNYRMTNLQGAMGAGQLKNINWIIKRKFEIGNMYYKKLKKINTITLQSNTTEYSNNIYWVFGILLKKNSKYKRNRIMNELLKFGIETRPFFVPMNEQKIFRKLKIFKNKKFLNSHFISNNGFYLPSGLGIENKEIEYICEKLKIILSKFN